MTACLAPGPYTFTVERINEVLVCDRLKGSQDGSRAAEFRALDFSSSQTHNANNSKTRVVYHNAEIQMAKAKQKCNELFEMCAEDDYIGRLDEVIAQRLECNFDIEGQSEDAMMERASEMLQRLPFVSPPMKEPVGLDIYSDLSADHFIKDEKKPAAWDTLLVSSFIDRNVIRMALYLATYQGDHNISAFTPACLRYVNEVVLLLEATHLLAESEHDKGSQLKWFILQAFLWTAWHRSMLLLFSYELMRNLRQGTDFMSNPPQIALKSTGLIAKLSKSNDLPTYMCRWAYELIRTDRATAGLDLRTLCARYEDFMKSCGHGEHDGRCIIGSDGKPAQCDGSSPIACTRFRGLKIEDQSAHDSSCDRHCQRLYWNEKSYRDVKGARAVSMESIDSDEILYCLASRRTMSISHVWSHGQGGRPEKSGTGFNKCLHQRYCEIARRNGCDSYWMDTPCIPEDSVLRKEAIAQINNVFMNSTLTLVCDRDIMEMDIHDPTIAIKEMILATILVCDWNVRAWTFLEAMRGRTDLHLLCQNHQTISLKSLIDDVNREGSTELAVLFLTAQHLIPTSGNIEGSTDRDPGFLPVEEAATLLSRRYATRAGDEVVIWSLLCGNQVFQDATAFWKAKIFRDYHKSNPQYPEKFGMIYTGFLVSSAPRIEGQKALSWAPSRPDIAYSDPPETQQKVFYAYDGRDTALGFFGDDGLEANWLVFEFRCYKVASKMMVNLLTPFKHQYLSQLAKFGLEKLKGFKWGALLQVTNNDGLMPPRGVYQRGDKIGDDVAVPHRGNNSDRIVVLVGSCDRENWQWLGVYEWDEQVELPKFERQVMYIL